MKRLVILLSAITFAVVLHAQEGVAIGLQVGFAESIHRLNDPTAEDYKKLNSKAQNGFKIGLVTEGTFWKGMGTMIGINYTFVGANTKWESLGMFEYPKTRTRSNMHQLEIFVDWQYKFEIAKNTYVLLYTGPTIQAGLSMSGTVINKMQDDKSSEIRYDSYDYDDAYYKNDFNRLNVTWGLGAGFQYERYYIRGGYDFGTMNPYRVKTFEGSDHYTRGRLDQWHVKLGIFLWEK